MNKKNLTKKAFVLLYALLVAGIVLSIGMSLANIITKQIILSSLGRSSRVAYYAADAGRACGYFWGPGYGALLGRGLYYPEPDQPAINKNILCNVSEITATTGTDDVVGVLSLYGIDDISGRGYQRDDFSFDISVAGQNVAACSKVTVLSFPPADLKYQSIILSRGFSDNCQQVDNTAGRRTVSRTVLGLVKKAE